MDTSTQRIPHTTGPTFRAAKLVTYRNQGGHSKTRCREHIPSLEACRGGQYAVLRAPLFGTPKMIELLPFSASIGSTALARESCSGVADCVAARIIRIWVF